MDTATIIIFGLLLAIVVLLLMGRRRQREPGTIIELRRSQEQVEQLKQATDAAVKAFKKAKIAYDKKNRNGNSSTPSNKPGSSSDH